MISTQRTPAGRVGIAPRWLRAVWRAPLLSLLAFQGTELMGRALDFIIDYSKNPDLAVIRAHDFSILSPEANVDLAAVRGDQRQIYAYLSVVEIAADAPYRQAALAKGIPLLGTNEIWNSDLADVSHPAWAEFVLDQLATCIAAKGFDGFFLDTVDSLSTLAERYPSRAESFRSGLIKLVKTLHARYPSQKIILNRGFSVWQEVRGEKAGFLAESLFQTYDFKSRTYTQVPAGDTDWLLTKLQMIKAAGIPVFVVDYVDPTQPELAAATASKIERVGFHALVTTPELKGQVLAPLQEAPRFLLALYGNQTEDVTLRIRRPAESFIAEAVQMPLEWLGYEVDYLNPSTEALPEQLDAKYVGVILDHPLEVPHYKEAELASWLSQQKKQGRKVIFLGTLPFQKTESRRLLAREFDLGGAGRSLLNVSNLQAAAIAKQMSFEARVRLLPSQFLDLQAPPGAAVQLSVVGQDGQGEARQFDAVFICPWGGAMLQPYMTFTRPDKVLHWLVNPFEFLAGALSPPDWPVPDATTRDGVRIFYTHIDGDGFRHLSSVDPGKRSAEVIFERVIKKYPFPFTCSVIEAEIRGLIKDQPPEDASSLSELARAIFAWPRVQAGSHTYSHPFFWSSDDRTAHAYAEQGLELRSPYQPKGVDLKREIAGSMGFIEKHLLPPGQKVEIFLWSGNCHPPPEALRMTRELGVENMNGGDTIISRKHPTLIKVAPRGIPWGGELQVHAANVNENVYWDRLGGSATAPDAAFYGGFVHVVDAFQRTESPRRLKPVNIYFHYYSGDNWAALNALTAAFDWATQQELHSLTAAQYARVVRDCRATRLFRKQEHRWIIVNEGSLRTYRLPKTQFRPDLASSRGVIGYRVVSDAVYVHTDGSKRVELVLADQPVRHLFLISSTAEIQFEKLAPQDAIFSVKDFRPCQVTLGGFPAQAQVSVSVNDKVSVTTADAEGQLRFNLPNQARVTVQSS